MKRTMDRGRLRNPGADRTVCGVVASCWAILSGKIDDLQMQFVPVFFREYFFEVGFCLFYCFAV